MTSMPLHDLLLSVKRAAALQWLATALLGLLCLALAALSFRQAGELAWLARHRPIHVVPGAAEGVYAPGLARHNIANAARYLLGLAVDLTPATASRRLQELERYLDPVALPVFRSERDRRLKEIEGQQQSRSLYPDSPDELTEDEGVYRYTVRGRWEIRSGSLPMSDDRHQFTMRFRVGTADETNPYGVRIVAFEVRRLDVLKTGTDRADRPDPPDRPDRPDRTGGAAHE
jgi:hypothetical protein